MASIDWSKHLSRFRRLLKECGDGRGGIVVVSGGYGYGKSDLLASVIAHARSASFQVLSAVGSFAERALALGVVAQLLRDADLSDHEAGAAAGLLADGMSSPMPASAQFLLHLCLAVLNLARKGPVLLCVDDIQYADEPSLQCLLALVRRIRGEPVLMVLAGTMFNRPTGSTFAAELLRQPHFHQVALRRLSVDDIVALVEQTWTTGPDKAPTDPARERTSAATFASACWSMTGGNPLLVKALLDDCTPGPGGLLPERPAPADGFSQAALGCLYCGELVTARIAEGMATLGESATPELLCRLLDTDLDTVERLTAELVDAGLVTRYHLRHPALRQAVEASMDVESRRHLHRRAADLLHRDGAPATEVARHLLGSSGEPEPWMVPILWKAAEQSRAEDDPERAVALLELAEAACDDDRNRVAVATELLRVRWRLDPAGALHQLPYLLGELRRGRLGDEQVAALAKPVLWHGLLPEATEAMRRWPAGPADEKALVERHIVERWVHTAYPPLAARLPVGSAGTGLPGPVADADLRVKVADGLAVVLDSRASPEARETAATAAEEALQWLRLDDDTVDALYTALHALMYAERFDNAKWWCEDLLARAGRRRAPWWQGMLAALRAEIAVRTGDLPTAAEYASTAIHLTCARSWGLAIGLPLGTLLRSTAAMGEHEEAARYLDWPVADAMFQTRFGLHYMYGRGHHFLATGRPQAALAEFLTCGDLMDKWRLDVPWLVPWRTDAAEACLRLGDPERARELVTEQLALLDGQDNQAYGVSLRLLAATSAPHRRPALLQDAVDALQSGGDRLQLARALGDLGQAFGDLGEPERARTAAGLAWRIAKDRRAESLCRELLPVIATDQAAEPVPELPVKDGTITLSRAERRVAALAALGQTNRQIADKLYITVSTVEQHLTRVYRKLDVHRRSDLPSWLLADVA